VGAYMEAIEYALGRGHPRRSRQAKSATFSTAPSDDTCGPGSWPVYRNESRLDEVDMRRSEGHRHRRATLLPAELFSFLPSDATRSFGRIPMGCFGQHRRKRRSMLSPRSSA
jgi:hypothetical protein